MAESVLVALGQRLDDWWTAPKPKGPIGKKTADSESLGLTAKKFFEALVYTVSNFELISTAHAEERDQSSDSDVNRQLKVITESVSNAIRYLQRWLNDPDYRVRLKAVSILAERKTPEVVKDLIRILREDSNKLVRAKAAWVLGRLGASEAFHSLLFAAEKDPSLQVRLRAIEALGKLGNEKALPLLRKIAAEAQSEKLRAKAIRTIEKIKEKATPIFPIADMTQAMRDGILTYVRVKLAEAVAGGRDKTLIGDEVKKLLTSLEIELMVALGASEKTQVSPEESAAQEERDKIVKEFENILRIAGGKATPLDVAIKLAEKGDFSRALAILKGLPMLQPGAVQTNLSEMLANIFDAPGFTAAASEEKAGGFSIKTYTSFPDYHLVHDETGKLVTILNGSYSIEGSGDTATLTTKTPSSLGNPIPIVFDNFSRTTGRFNEFMAAYQDLPTGFFDGLARISFRDKDSPTALGNYWSRKINVYPKADSGTLPHELTHYWDLGVTNKMPDPSHIFYSISWKRDADSATASVVEKRRDGDSSDFRGSIQSSCASRDCANGPDLSVKTSVHPYGMENPREDMATWGEDYYISGSELRKKVREDIAKGNFEPAAKYLFIKYVTPMEGKEYGQTSKEEPRLGYKEVTKEIKKFQQGGGIIRKETLDALKQIVSRASVKR